LGVVGLPFHLPRMPDPFAHSEMHSASVALLSHPAALPTQIHSRFPSNRQGVHASRRCGSGKTLGKTWWKAAFRAPKHQAPTLENFSMVACSYLILYCKYHAWKHVSSTTVKLCGCPFPVLHSPFSILHSGPWNRPSASHLGWGLDAQLSPV
jgi:hypothetical protein